jgi:hypothetical protein
LLIGLQLKKVSEKKMPKCLACLEISEQEFTGDNDHQCQATSLGDQGTNVEVQVINSNSTGLTAAQVQRESPLPAVQRADPFELEVALGHSDRDTSLPRPRSYSRSLALETIHRAIIRRTEAITSGLEEFGASELRSPIARGLPAVNKADHQRHRRHNSSAASSGPRPLPSIPEQESDQDPEGESGQEAELNPEATLFQSSTRSIPTPPLTPWRRLLLIQDYTDRDEAFGTTINRLDDAIASSPELWIPGFFEGIDGQPVTSLQFYRRLHEFHQQRIANHAPSSIPYFFPRLGAKRYEW